MSPEDGRERDGNKVKQLSFTLPTERRIVVRMSNTSYTLRISPQGQLTLPRGLRERLRVQPGSHITVAVIDGGTLQISNEPPIAKYFGTLAGAWTADGED